MNEYGELYAFDDGAMPKYELSQLPGTPVPFYGLQDVKRIELPHKATEEEIVESCREHCVLIISSSLTSTKKFRIRSWWARRCVWGAIEIPAWLSHLQEAPLSRRFAAFAKMSHELPLLFRIDVSDGFCYQTRHKS